MKNVKKAVALMLSILVILACTHISFAATIQAKDDNETNNPSNNTSNNTNNTSDNTANNTSNTNNIVNNNSVIGSTNNNTPQAISSSNATGDIPKTGIGDTNLNIALIVLLALVLGMFSLVQYNKIIKKDD